MRKIFVIALMVLLAFGCARLSVGGSREPIKVDISMRLDVYQHVVKDIDNIEDIVSGGKQKSKTQGNQSWLDYIVPSAYAQGLDPEVEKAALSRKDRYDLLISLEEKGVVGENKLGLVEVRNTKQAEASARELVKQENNDRMVIYKSLAQKNGVSVDEIQKIYAKKLQEIAPAGTAIEVLSEKTQAYEWKVK